MQQNTSISTQNDVTQSWQELVKVALLGTERQTKAPALTELAQQLAQLYPDAKVPTDTQREAAFLSAAALIGTYYRAGLAVDEYPSELAQTQSEQTTDAQTLVNEAAINHLRQIITDNELFALLPEWLALLAQQKLCLPPLLLPQLLDIALRKKHLRAPIVKVMGKRGVWLAGLQSQWQDLLLETDALETDDSQEIWELGTLAQRQAWLAQLRRLDSAKARQLLQQSWKQDAAKDRAALLQTLENALQSDDEEFLQGCLSDKSKEVRHRAAGLLCQLPGSDFGQRITQRLQNWLQFTPKSGVMGSVTGKKGTLTVNLPEQWDKTWVNDGISEKAPSGKGQKAWWLEQTLSLVPPTHWCELWQLSAADVLNLTKKHEWEEPLRAGLFEAIVRHKDAQFAQQWLLLIERDVDHLWKMLQPSQAEQVLTQLAQKSKNKKDLLSVLADLNHINHAWSEAFSNQVIDFWLQVFDSRKQAVRYMNEVFKRTAMSLHIDCMDYFNNSLKKHLDPDSPHADKLLDVLDSLRFRHQMHQAITRNEVTP